MTKKKLLILGGSGFIATNLLNHFCNNDEYEVYTTIHETKLRNLSSKLHRYSYADLTNKKHVESAIKGMDIVIHAAAVTTGSKDVVERPYLHVTDNIVMNSYVFQSCHELGVKHCIFLSCTVMYQPNENPQSETDWNPGEEIYKSYFGVGNMKVFSERLCEFYSRLGDTKYTAVRHSNVYGPYDKFDLNKCHVLPAMINKVCSDKSELEIWGSGKAARDVIYIDDLVNFLQKCIERQESNYELFNCGYGQAFPILDIINKIMSYTGKTKHLIFNKSKPDIPTTVVLDCKKAENLYGWKHQISLEEGIAKTVDWYEQNSCSL